MRGYVKKLVFIFLAGLLAVAVAGCGKSGSPDSGSKKIDFPTKSMNLIVPYAAGGSSDLSARPFADQMQKIIGQPMVVVNRPGAGGAIGAAEVARAKADGYTLLNGSIGNVTIVPYTSDVGYTYKDFKPVAQMTDIPLALAVKKDSPFNNLVEFVNYAKEHPGQIKVGTPGAGNIQHVTLERFSKQVGIKLQHMPYEGANPAVAALLGAHIEATMTGTTEVTGQYKSGEVKVLGVTSDKRIDFMPQVPTFKEQGYDLSAGVWYGVLASKDTPDEIVNKLADAMKQASESEDVRKAWEKLYLIPSFLGPQDFAKRIEQEAQDSQKVLKEVGLSK